MKNTFRIVSRFAVGLAYGVALISLAAPSYSLADTQEKVLTIETDAFQGVWEIFIVRKADGAMSEMILRDEKGERHLTLEQLHRQTLVKEVDGHQVVFLSLEDDFDAYKGGHAIMRYLNSGISGSYRNFRILVDVQRDIVIRGDANLKDRESDRNRYNSVFNHLFLQKNTFFGKTIGISRVVPSLQ